MKRHYAFVLAFLAGLFLTTSVCSADWFSQCGNCDLNDDGVCDSTDLALFTEDRPDLDGSGVFDQPDGVLFNTDLEKPQCRYGICICGFAPDSTSVERGVDDLGFYVAVRNVSDLSGVVRFSTRATLPTGQQLPVWGPFAVPLAASGDPGGGDLVGAPVTHVIPGSLPLGDYTYKGYVSVFGTVIAECGFEFEVTGVDEPELRNWNYR